MRGTAYAIGEIIAFLVLAGLVGVGIGLLIGWGRQWTKRPAAPVDTAETERADRLAARVHELETAQAGTADSGRRIEALQKELSVAQWQIDALEEELGKHDASAEAG